jgi:hypothetical protein
MPDAADHSAQAGGWVRLSRRALRLQRPGARRADRPEPMLHQQGLHLIGRCLDYRQADRGVIGVVAEIHRREAFGDLDLDGRMATQKVIQARDQPAHGEGAVAR